VPSIDHDGNIAFSEFVVATAVFAGQCSVLDSCKVLFEICDVDADNRVGKDELNKVSLPCPFPLCTI
jgi:Ca2+-binding EF-hand superfamily protein